MKQLLLLAVIHLLIYHQYKKDKSEVLAPKKTNNTVRPDVLPGKQEYLFSGVVGNTTDSLHSRRSGPLRPNYVSYSSWVMHINK
jgi:hypothetical protein